MAEIKNNVRILLLLLLMFVVLEEDDDDNEVLVILLAVAVLIEPLEEMVILAFGVNGDDGVEFILVLLTILFLPLLAALLDTMSFFKSSVSCHV